MYRRGRTFFYRQRRTFCICAFSACHRAGAAGGGGEYPRARSRDSPRHTPTQRAKPGKATNLFVSSYASISREYEGVTHCKNSQLLRIKNKRKLRRPENLYFARRGEELHRRATKWIKSGLYCQTPLGSPHYIKWCGEYHFLRMPKQSSICYDNLFIHPYPSSLAPPLPKTHSTYATHRAE